MKIATSGWLVAATVLAAGTATSLAQVKISQVYGGGGNTGAQYNRDFVELVNTGGAPVDITGWSIQYAATAGTTWTNRALPSAIIPPGGYYLISMNTTNGTNGVALPTPDFQVATTVAMSATDAKVALMRTATTITTGTACVIGDGNLEDFVGYGTSNCFEGAGAAPQLSNTAAAFRALDGCFDTDNNIGNFNAGAPNPRNSAAAALVCSGTHTDLSIAVSGGACGVTTGSAVAFTATVSNGGVNASDATVTFNIPANMSFVSSVPAGVPVGNVLTMNLGSVAPASSAALTVNLTATSAGGSVATASVASSVNDPGQANNSASASALIAPATANAKGIFSSLASLANSDVPAGLSPAGKFFFTTSQSETFGRLFPSHDGTRIVFRGLSNLATTSDQMIVSFPTANPAAAATLVQEGVTDLGGGELVQAMDNFPSINNAGDISFSADTNAASNDEVVVKRTAGGMLTVVAREGGLNGVGNAIGTNATAFGITNAGDVMYWHQGPTLNTSDQHVLLGSAAVAQEGFSIPGNQVGGGTSAWFQFDNGSDLGKYQDVSGDGAHTLLSGDIGTSTTDTLVLDGNVILMDGSTINGITGTVTDIRFADLYDGANWFAYGSNTAEDWVLLNGAVLTKVDAPITQGSTEIWDDAAFAQTFFVAAANANGTYVVGGTTNNADQLNNAVVVLNGRIVLVRENDPVDLDGNGLFDDDAYIKIFRDDRFVLLNDALYFAAELRNSAAYCSGNASSKLCDALIRIPVPCPADLDDGSGNGIFDGGVDINDLLYFLNNFEAGNIDLDNDGDPATGIPDGGTDINDLLFFLSRFENGC